MYSLKYNVNNILRQFIDIIAVNRGPMGVVEYTGRTRIGNRAGEARLDLQQKNQNRVFDYKALRLLIGIIALSLPYVVILVSHDALTSISGSYYTHARDEFVGMLFVVGAFLVAYNGHTVLQGIASRVAALATFMIALFPTSCDGCPGNLDSAIHAGSAATLFSILAYFCLGPFRYNTRNQSGSRGRRDIVYVTCGWAMILSIAVVVAGKLFLPAETVSSLRLVYWAELVALNAFGIAWIVAGKVIPGLVEKEEALVYFGRD